MQRFLKRIYRERRRFLVVAVLTFLGGFLWSFGMTMEVPGKQRVASGLVPVFGGLVLAAGLTTILMIIAIIIPPSRYSAEVLAVMFPLIGLLGFLDEGLIGQLGMDDPRGFIILIVLIVAIYQATWLDQLLPNRPRRLHSRATSKLQPEELSPYLKDNPDMSSVHGEEGTLSMKATDPGVSLREGMRAVSVFKVLKIAAIAVDEAPSRNGFTFEEPDTAKPTPMPPAKIEYRLTRNGDGTNVETIREFDRITIRAELMIWIDDTLGRQDDKKILHAEATERSRQSDSKAQVA